MAPLTRFLSRLFGLYYILAAISMILHKQAYVETVTNLLRNSPEMFIVAIITVIAGLAMVLAHNVWSGGAVAVIVTLIGWITLIKGAVFLFLPPEAQREFFLTRLHYQELFYVYAAISLAIGIYLAYGGFASNSQKKLTPA